MMHIASAENFLDTIEYGFQVKKNWIAASGSQRVPDPDTAPDPGF
jgi:hypothetical protein